MQDEARRLFFRHDDDKRLFFTDSDRKRLCAIRRLPSPPDVTRRTGDIYPAVFQRGDGCIRGRLSLLPDVKPRRDDEGMNISRLACIARILQRPIMAHVTTFRTIARPMTNHEDQRKAFMLKRLVRHHRLRGNQARVDQLLKRLDGLNP